MVLEIFLMKTGSQEIALSPQTLKRSSTTILLQSAGVKAKTLRAFNCIMVLRIGESKQQGKWLG